ncbi:metallophosphoesterase family protein [Thermodesulfobacteriota bacterium]
MAKQTIIHLSDLHVGLRPKESNSTKKIFEAIAESFPGVPVIITGDLTDSAKRSEFGKARELLDTLARTNPLLAVPGNHDYAWKGNILREEGWARWMKHLGSPLGWSRGGVPWMGVNCEPEGIDGLGIWKNGPCVYFGIDSGDPLDKKISAKGFISKKLANALNESLKKYSGKTRIAFLHHHPFSEGFFTKLHGSKRLMDALKGNCELLLFGHHHECGIWKDSKGLPLVIASHKSTDNLSGDCLMIAIIDILNVGTQNVTFNHRMDVIPLK